MAQFTEDEKIMRRLEQRFNKGVVKYRLIEDGDKILIALSGGKDSLALLELLETEICSDSCACRHDKYSLSI